ncbi:class I poly(R)-hydroxyalkanoic acid synthase [Aquisalimonas lutea]|uniref:PHA/PHB synthase family protein n=1 Tax=Aquisalimonas lutea TaxID=1327750 RepID=UPI0025B5779B|nr:class I poly(R)-hydroxyalkanoic acid synthase [Aquisalimonas lutea]MDN3516252.1 class I poly(R)-hydroxyalkanoic acid synthase [Aquisalimonas lutea]
MDVHELSRTLVDISTRSQELVNEFVTREQSAHRIDMDDALHLVGLFQQLTSRMVTNPVELAQGQIAFWQDYLQLINSTALRMLGQPSESVIHPARGDKRFAHDAWDDSPLFDFIKQSYLLAADYVHSTVCNVDGLDEATARKVDFHTRQFVDALSPTNFVATNPEVLERTVETGGQNLLRGLRNLLDDLSSGNGRLRISMTDTEAFEVGRNLAVTPGKVVYQNELIQLIQYSPATEQVYQRPLLFVPPWINKYYILDLQPGNSLIRYMVEQGHTVFVISWKNPTSEYADMDFEDYMFLGPLAALDAIEQATGERSVNVAGYCLGGTLMGAAAAYMAAQGDDRLGSITFLTAMLDFSWPGELEIFIDEEQLDNLERRMESQGYLEGNAMATTMATLRANDLIWSFFINNYLKGDDPFPFDLLYWNQDCTNMPARMHAFYLRNMYQENRLKEPGGIELGGVPIDLQRIRTPHCFVAAREDHIAPWHTCYRGVHLMQGDNRFILGGAGHIAGIVNPPARAKYAYWTSDATPPTGAEWLDTATRHEGSWWPEWNQWLVDRAGGTVPARTPGDGGLTPIEDAPGSYVREKA